MFSSRLGERTHERSLSGSFDAPVMWSETYLSSAQARPHLASILVDSRSIRKRFIGRVMTVEDGRQVSGFTGHFHARSKFFDSRPIISKFERRFIFDLVKFWLSTASQLSLDGGLIVPIWQANRSNIIFCACDRSRVFRVATSSHGPVRFPFLYRD